MTSIREILRRHIPGAQRAEYSVVVNLAAVANAARETVIDRPDLPVRVTGIDVINIGAAPASAMGTITLAVSNRDASAGANDNLLSAATFDLETVGADSETAMTLTATEADRLLDTPDRIFATVTSNNADATGLDGLALRVRYAPRS